MRDYFATTMALWGLLGSWGLLAAPGAPWRSDAPGPHLGAQGRAPVGPRLLSPTTLESTRSCNPRCSGGVGGWVVGGIANPPQACGKYVRITRKILFK